MTNVNLDSQGRFAFVECRTEELATQALALDKVRNKAMENRRERVAYASPSSAGLRRDAPCCPRRVIPCSW